jgi:hypothetical protein
MSRISVIRYPRADYTAAIAAIINTAMIQDCEHLAPGTGTSESKFFICDDLKGNQYKA